MLLHVPGSRAGGLPNRLFYGLLFMAEEEWWKAYLAMQVEVRSDGVVFSNGMCDE